MTSLSLKNISVKTYKKYLEFLGCKCTRKNGGHEIYTKKYLLRPIVVQSHITPVPEFIIKNGLKQLGVSREDFHKWLTNNHQ